MLAACGASAGDACAGPSGEGKQPPDGGRPEKQLVGEAAGSFSSRTCERQRRGQARHARWTGLLWPGRRVRVSPPGGSPAVGPGVSKEQGDLGRMASDED